MTVGWEEIVGDEESCCVFVVVVKGSIVAMLDGCRVGGDCCVGFVVVVIGGGCVALLIDDDDVLLDDSASAVSNSKILPASLRRWVDDAIAAALSIFAATTIKTMIPICNAKFIIIQSPSSSRPAFFLFSRLHTLPPLSIDSNLCYIISTTLLCIAL